MTRKPHEAEVTQEPEKAPEQRCDVCGWHGTPTPDGSCPNNNCPRHA